MNDKVNFGLLKIKKSDKTESISKIFSSVSNKYDLMNDLMSFGLHRLWKTQMCRLAKIKKNDIALDVASGTGDLVVKILSRQPKIEITCLDENPDMLDICKDRLVDSGHIKNTKFVITSIEDFIDHKEKFTLATIAFGFRNFTDHNKALYNLYNTLKPGGRLLIMDFKTPSNESVKKLYDIYTDNIIPNIGKFVANDYDSYKYLSDSIKTYYKPDEVKELLSNSGFTNIRYETLVGDIVTIHIGYKC